MVFFKPAYFSELSQLEEKYEKDFQKLIIESRPNGPEPDDLDNILTECQNRGGAEFLAKLKNTLTKFYKGPVLEYIDLAIEYTPKVGPYNFCKWAIHGEKEKLFAWIKEINNNSIESHKIRNGLYKVLENATQPETKITRSLLACYIRAYVDKLIAVQPNAHGTKDFYIQVTDRIYKPAIVLLEKEEGETKDCVLPSSEKNPTNFKFPVIPLMRAINNLGKKGQ